MTLDRRHRADTDIDRWLVELGALGMFMPATRSEFSVAAVADWCGVSEEDVRRWLENGVSRDEVRRILDPDLDQDRDQADTAVTDLGATIAMVLAHTDRRS